MKRYQAVIWVEDGERTGATRERKADAEKDLKELEQWYTWGNNGHIEEYEITLPF
jgi:hypothetical protein